jgi:hypothetical protein
MRRAGARFDLIGRRSDLLELAEKDQTIDVASLALRAPDEHWDAFSMGGEHVTHEMRVPLAISIATQAVRVSGPPAVTERGHESAPLRGARGQLDTLCGVIGQQAERRPFGTLPILPQ